MHRTVVVVAALCVLSSVAIATTAPNATTSMGTTLPGDGEPESAPMPVPSPLSTATGGTQPRAMDSSSAVLVTPAGNTTAYLAIPPGNVSNTTVTGATLDVGGALAVSVAATSEEIDALTLDERLSRANTTAAKQAVIQQAGTRIEQRIDSLEAEQRATIDAYSDGDVSTREFIYALTRTQTRAEGLRRAVDHLEIVAGSVPGTAIGGESVDSWARDRLVQLGIVTSPLRERIVAAFQGTGPIEVFVEVSDTGVVLATTDRGMYVRDAYLPAERDDGPRDGPNSPSAALDRVIAAYPWAWNHSTGVESGGGPAAGSYQITVFHQQGRLTTHLDPSTGNVFREIQVKRLEAVPTTSAVNATDNGLRMQVRPTYPTGPMNVSIVDSRTMEPVNATVLVDNRTVGRTGSEGYRWTITPRGDVNVTVTDGDRVVTARFTADRRLTATDRGRTPKESGVKMAPTSRLVLTDGQSTPPANRSTGVGNATTAETSNRTTAVGVRDDAGDKS